MAEGDTWENKENLENAGDLLQEFEEEYGRDDREVRRQERTNKERDYWRGGLPGQYTARRLFGWSDREYNQQYWQRLERNWRQWKKVEPIEKVKRKLTAVCEIVEEEGGKIEEWDKRDEMGQIGDALNEL